jgi:signal transduction histidine kinase
MPSATRAAKRKLLAAESRIRRIGEQLATALDAGAQHDLRNALALVIAFSQLLDTEADAELLADAGRALERARELTCSVLAGTSAAAAA